MLTKALNLIKKCRKPKFAVGQMVRILEPEKIYKTLDHQNKLDGILFMDQMEKYCGKEYTVIKVVKTFEFEKLLLRARLPIYMLDGLMCNGESKLLEHKCDLCCYFMWHEDWIEKL